METGISSCSNSRSPMKDTTACLSQSAVMMCQNHLLYDQHSSEEELEVINGPSSIAAAEAAANISIMRDVASSSLISERESSSLEAEELFDEASTSKRSSSTLLENRKRSLAHSSDDELRNFLEPILTPVNFRTSPPLEAFKPNRSHMLRSTTPLILSEARCGIENIKLCDNSVNDENGSKSTGNKIDGILCSSNEIETSTNINKICASSLRMSNSSHHIYQPQPKYNIHYNSSRSSPASTTGLDVEVRSVSPPAKLFHCAISPRRRPMRTQQTTQRLQRPHRPCLDFDKMQQVSL